MILLYLKGMMIQDNPYNSKYDGDPWDAYGEAPDGSNKHIYCQQYVPWM